VKEREKWFLMYLSTIGAFFFIMNAK